MKTLPILLGISLFAAGCNPFANNSSEQNTPPAQPETAQPETAQPADAITAPTEPKAPAAEPEKPAAEPEKPAAEPEKPAAEPAPEPANAPQPAEVKEDPGQVIESAQKLQQEGQYDEALRLLLNAQFKSGALQELENAYQEAIRNHPQLNAQPKQLIPGQDLTGMKRLGGGSSLVYKFTKDKQTIAAFKPFQKRFQSNYRSEIAAYRLCPVMKCAFDIPVNVPIYFDYKDFSSLYGRNAANPKEEFAEIIPTHLPGDIHRVEGTFKEWIPEFADFPIEFSFIWKPWLNPGTDKSELAKPVSDLLPQIAKKHKGGDKFAAKLAPHVQNLSQYDLARQISNLLVFDFLINNWDRFSGSPSLFGVNCQIAHGRFMSIDNGAGFAKTPNSKPEKHLHEITRFSRLTYTAISNFQKEPLLNYLFPDATDFEKEKFETFWQQRQKYLDYVKKCINDNGEAETFFFE
ncbi:MAG: hypothetical protein IJM59_00620 [Proteobacteria bacterium]|nr:hypothetical protein [Pseudomonadota bacterium]